MNLKKVIPAALTIVAAASSLSLAKGLPSFPTIAFPDGVEYRVSSLCVDGENLRVAGQTHGQSRECSQGSFDGGCARYERVELVTPLNYNDKRCVRQEERALPVPGANDGGPTSITVCAEYQNIPRRHALSYDVPVLSSPTGTFDGGVASWGEQIGSFEYTIPACK